MRRKEAIYNFYEAYAKLKKYKNVLLHTRTDKEGTVIEIDRYSGATRRERILRISRQDDIEAYERATDNINNMLKQIKEEAKTEV